MADDFLLFQKSLALTLNVKAMVMLADIFQFANPVVAVMVRVELLKVGQQSICNLRLKDKIKDRFNLRKLFTIHE